MRSGRPDRWRDNPRRPDAPQAEQVRDIDRDRAEHPNADAAHDAPDERRTILG